MQRLNRLLSTELSCGRGLMVGLENLYKAVVCLVFEERVSLVDSYVQTELAADKKAAG